MLLSLAGKQAMSSSLGLSLSRGSNNGPGYRKHFPLGDDLKDIMWVSRNLLDICSPLTENEETQKPWRGRTSDLPSKFLRRHKPFRLSTPEKRINLSTSEMIDIAP